MAKHPVEEELATLRARLVELEGAERRARDAEAEVARAQALLRAAVASAPVGLGVADEDGELLLWNDAMLAASGFAPSEVEAWKAARASDAARASRRRWLEVIRSRGGLSAQEVEIPRRDGTFSTVVLTATPIEVGDAKHLHVTMQDVTELKRVEQALRESELRFRQVTGTIRQVFYITSGDHRQLLYVSPAYEELWGRSCESLYADPHSWVDAIHPEDRGGVAAALTRETVDRQYAFEFRIVRPDGSIRWISDKAYQLLDADGAVYRIVGIAFDITDRRILEEQLRDAQKMDAIGKLAGGVAHDFNNLLTTIQANVSLLLRTTPSGDPRREPLQDVRTAVDRAAQLTRRLLGFSRRAVLRLEPVDLRRAVQETAALLRRTLDPRVHLVVEEPEELATVLADAGEMSQVLLNLCLNGRDAMPEGGTLRVSTCACVVSEEEARRSIDARPGEVVCLTVEDTGAGIPAEVRGRIFEPFFTTKEPGAGTGLGLAMVFGIVKQHKGWIELTSDVGTGTRFDVFLPRHDGPSAGAPTAAPSSSRAPARGTILFVDDEAALRKVASTILSEHGYRVLLAEDGVAALAILERERDAIDLVILDLRMPRLSGRDTLHAMWRLHPQARVLVSSGHADDHERIAQTEPVAGSLPKPYGFEELVGAVRAALDDGPVHG